MNSKLFSLAIACAAGVTALPVIAQEQAIPAAYVEDVGAQERINLSGKLRMLSQRIPSAACHLAEGIDPEGASKLLAGATAEFEKILTGLEFGDADLKIIGTERHRGTLAQIHDLRSKWEPVKAAAQSMVAGDLSDDKLAVILDQNLSVLGSAKILVSDLIGQYSNPFEMTQSDSMLIDISGRQRMLTQKMSKESCVVSHNETLETADELAGTMQMFEVSLMALVTGMPDAGVAPPPNAEIVSGLYKVVEEWTDLKPTLEAIQAGEKLDATTEANKFNKLNVMMGKMNEVVGMYTAAAKKEY